LPGDTGPILGAPTDGEAIGAERQGRAKTVDADGAVPGRDRRLDTTAGASARVAAWLAMIAVIVVLGGYSLYRPAGNSDVVEYVATVHMWHGLSGQMLSDATYRDLAAFLTPAQYSDVTGGAGDPATNRNAYLHALATDPTALAEQIPFYSVKPLYPALMAGLNALGLPLGVASVLISSIAYGLLGLLLFAWFIRHLSPWRAWLVTTLLLVSPPFWVLGQLSSPDAITLLIVAIGAFAFVELRRPWVAIAVLLVAVLARPNVALLALAFVGAAAVATESSRVRIRPSAAVAAGAAAVMLAFALQKLSGNYGLGTLYYHAVVAYLPHPSLGAPAVALGDIVREYVYRTVGLALSPVPLFVLVGVLALFLRLPTANLVGASRRDPAVLAILAALLALIPGWLTYPNEPERILVGSFLVATAVLVISIGDARRVTAPVAP